MRCNRRVEAVIPHVINLAATTAAIVLSLITLRRLRRIHRDVRRVRIGNKEMLEGRRQLIQDLKLAPKKK